MTQKLYLIQSMRGLGDNIYQRAFLKVLSQNDVCQIDTPFPEIYQDLPNVYFKICSTHLRTQSKNVARTDYCGRPAHSMPTMRRHTIQLPQISYKNTGIMNGLSERFGCLPAEMDLPSFNPSVRISEIIGRKYAVIRPATIRKEWHSSSRNPMPEYIEEAVKILKANGYLTVSIADCDGDNEYFVGNKPECDIEFNHGELDVKEILCLVENANVSVGGIGWIVPACLAYKSKAIFICGGWGMYNHPDKLKPSYNVPQVSFLIPDKFCMCSQNNHQCNKTISNFSQKFKDLL